MKPYAPGARATAFKYQGSGLKVQLSGRCPINRVERKLLTIGDRLQALRSDRADVVAELDELREIAVESESDATYYDEAIDRADARLTAGDVSRFERLLAKLDSERDQLERRRDPPSRQALTVSSISSPVKVPVFGLRSQGQSGNSKCRIPFGWTRPLTAPFHGAEFQRSGNWTVDRGPWSFSAA